MSLSTSNTFSLPSGAQSIATSRSSFNNSFKALLQNFYSAGTPDTENFVEAGSSMTASQYNGVLHRNTSTGMLYISDSSIDSSRTTNPIGGNFTRYGIPWRQQGSIAAADANIATFDLGEAFAVIKDTEGSSNNSIWLRVNDTGTFATDFVNLRLPQPGVVESSATNHTQAGTGAEDQSVYSKLNQFYRVSDFNDGSNAASAAYQAGMPLHVANGEVAILTCDTSAGDDLKRMAEWMAGCSKDQLGEFYILLSEGAHEMTTFIDIEHASVPIDIRGNASPDLYPIQSISFNIAYPTEFTASTSTSNLTALTSSWVLDEELATNTTVMMNTTGTLPAPFQANTIYYVRDVDSANNRFKLANTPGDLAVTVTSVGSGTNTIFKPRYEANVDLGANTLPSYCEVGGAIGMHNIQGDNDAGVANGGQIIKSIEGDRSSFTFDFFSPKGIPDSPSALDYTAINGTTPNQVVCVKSWIVANSGGWDGGAREGFINIFGQTTLLLRYMGIVYDGPAGSNHDLIFAGNDSFLRLYDYVVLSGGGDKVVRGFQGSSFYLNRSCIGGAALADSIFDIAVGCSGTAVRCAFGGSRSHGLVFGTGTAFTITSCTIGGATTGVYVNGAGASVAVSLTQITKCTTGIYAIVGQAVITENAATKIINCSHAKRWFDGQGIIINDANYTNNTSDSTVVSAHPDIYLGGISDDNKLSIYEKGTWTPYFTGVSTPTYSAQTGKYIIVGDFVQARLKISVSSIDNLDTSSVVISGLPFTPDSADLSATVVTVDISNSDLINSNKIGMGGYLSGSSLVLFSGSGAFRYTDFKTSGNLHIAFNYESAE